MSIKNPRPAPAAPRLPVDAGGTRLRLRALHVMGHGSARVARAVGVHPTTVRDLVRGDTRTVSWQLRELITAVYDTWWDKRAPARTRYERGAATAARKRAIAGNWCAAAALDDDELDIPGYRPRQGWKPATGTGTASDIHPLARHHHEKEGPMRDNRITFELFTDVLGVLHRHGFTRGDDVHAGRAVLLAGDMARIYEGTQDYPYVHRPLHRAPIPPPLEPADQDNRDPVVLPASQRKTMLIALDIAADDMRNRAGMCTDCADQSCFACESRLREARAYNQLSDRILQAPEAGPAAHAGQHEPAGPPTADVGHDGRARPAPDREAGQRPSPAAPRSNPVPATAAPGRRPRTRARRRKSRANRATVTTPVSPGWVTTGRSTAPSSRSSSTRSAAPAPRPPWPSSWKTSPPAPPNPSPNPTWKPNHDPHTLDVTAMTITILETLMTSDRHPHTARQAPGRHGWEVSWLPGQTLDRNSAITAMILADTASSSDVHEGHRLWPHIQSWAEELGLTGPEAIARVSEPPGSGRYEEHATQLPGPEAEPEAEL